MVDAQSTVRNAIADYASGVYVPKENHIILSWGSTSHKYYCHLYDKNTVFFTSNKHSSDDSISIKCDLEDLMKIINVLVGSHVNVTTKMMVDTENGPLELYSIGQSFAHYSATNKTIPNMGRELFKKHIVKCFENMIKPVTIVEV